MKQIQYLNVNGDYMEVSCVQSATHMQCIYQSQNKVLNIKMVTILFYDTPLYVYTVHFFVNPTRSRLKPTSLVYNGHPSHLNEANCSALNTDAYSIVWNLTSMSVNAHTTVGTHATCKCTIVLKLELSKGVRIA
jgi:hypothetical protein